MTAEIVNRYGQVVAKFQDGDGGIFFLDTQAGGITGLRITALKKGEGLLYEFAGSKAKGMDTLKPGDERSIQLTVGELIPT